MVIIDGICYADDFSEVKSVVELKVLDGYDIYFKFNDGEERIYNFEHLLTQGVFQQIKDLSVFRSVELQYGCPTWLDATVDFDSCCIYEHGQKVHFENGEYKEI